MKKVVYITICPPPRGGVRAVSKRERRGKENEGGGVKNNLKVKNSKIVKKEGNVKLTIERGQIR